MCRSFAGLLHEPLVDQVVRRERQPGPACEVEGVVPDIRVHGPAISILRARERCRSPATSRVSSGAEGDDWLHSRHAALLFCCQHLFPRSAWNERLLKTSFWSLQFGIILMMTLDLFPVGLYQLAAVLTRGFWYARTNAFVTQHASPRQDEPDERQQRRRTGTRRRR